MLGDDERSRLEAMIKEFVFDKRFEAAKGFEITDAMQVVIAAQACLLVLELGLDYYSGVGTIIVHRSTVVLSGPRSTGTAGLVSSDPYPIDGQAHYGGPVMISWDAASYDARHPRRGLSVVFHEFAHKLDMLDGTVDGTPPLDDGLRERWIDRLHRASSRRFDAASTRASCATTRATNPGEFFAVATEVFFSTPVQLREEKPDLYGVLADFYRQDPAARYPAAEETSAG